MLRLRNQPARTSALQRLEELRGGAQLDTQRIAAGWSCCGLPWPCSPLPPGAAATRAVAAPHGCLRSLFPGFRHLL